MSWKVIQRIYDSSAAAGADFTALVTIGQVAHEDGIMADPRYTIETLAAYARVSERQLQRALPALAAAGEVVYLRAVGRGRTNVFGVLVGLGSDAAELVYRRAWTRAAVAGGTYVLLDQDTARTDPKGCRPVTLYTGRKGDSWSPFTVRKGDSDVRKGDTASPFRPDLSISGFPGIPVSTTTGQGAEAQKGNARRLGAGQAVTDEHLVRRLVGLGVYAQPAAAEAARQDPAWLEACARHVEALKRLGPVEAPGAVLLALIRTGPPLPVLPVPDPRPGAAHAAMAGGEPAGSALASSAPARLSTARPSSPAASGLSGAQAALAGLDDDDEAAAAFIRAAFPNLT